ncbi:16193_t:CDS:2 [Dentiscutata heterogama]|uniref:16193_t:CDS:1 n=1 Tax=Dentiscutata heterogama TaxID=1316150 RepID=A0ACA9KJE8_9GLOM|nr:16193_t:CDS:2 [Dentiscutata heterogama]
MVTLKPDEQETEHVVSKQKYYIEVDQPINKPEIQPVIEPVMEFEQVTNPEEQQTNNCAEIYAVIRALEICQDERRLLEIITDSKYVTNTMETWIKKWEENNYISYYHKPINGPEILLQFMIKMNLEFDAESVFSKKRKQYDNSELFPDSDMDEAKILSDQSKKTRLFNPITVTTGFKKKKTRWGFENNHIFSNLTDEVKEYLRSCWAMGIMFLIEESCKDFRNQMLDIKAIIKTAQEELDHMSFLQTRAIYVALVQQKNLFITDDTGTGKTRVLKFIMAHYQMIFGTKIKVTMSMGKAALELRSDDITSKTIHSAFRLIGVKALIIDECSMVNENLFDSIVYLFKREPSSKFLERYELYLRWDDGDFQTECKYSEDDAVRLFAFNKFCDQYNDQRDSSIGARVKKHKRDERKLEFEGEAIGRETSHPRKDIH